MKLKLNRIISIATLVASLIAILLVLKKPAPVGQPLAPASIAVNAQSFDQKMAEFDQATRTSTASFVTSNDAPASLKSEVRINSDEVNAALAQSLGTSGTAPTPTSDSVGPTIKDQQISFDGDLVHGQFLTTVAGKDVWITISGRLGEKNGYATFDPTEFKVGDLNIPVSLVNPALQKKLAEQRDRLKLPDQVGNLKVENSQLVMQQK